MTGDVDAAYLNRLEELRNDGKRFENTGATSSDNGIIDLYNDED